VVLETETQQQQLVALVALVQFLFTTKRKVTKWLLMQL
jgi:hypothetical protein